MKFNLLRKAHVEKSKLILTSDCASDIGRKNVAIMHTITKDKHDLLIQNQFGTGLIQSTVILKNDLLLLLQDTPAGPINFLEFNWDEETGVINIGQRTDPPADPNAVIDYSKCLFLGITVYDPTVDKFVFTKGITMNDNDTIIFKTVDANNVNLHFYDVSNDLP